MTTPKYKALWYKDDIFALQTSARTDYSIQHCEVEIELSSDGLVDVTLDLEIGARIYIDQDATEFFTTTENWFDWYQSTIVYSAELEVVPVYDKERAQPVVHVKAEFAVDLADTISQGRMDANDAYIAA